jgi:pyruvate dehydrogenase E2 component (dihydrolipoamide acetyltransferase)
MPALEMAQESGVLVSWLKQEGEKVEKGEPLMAIETDKVTVEIEAPASGFLGGVLAREGQAVPVGQTIAWILAEGEKPPGSMPPQAQSGRVSTLPARAEEQRPMGRASVEISPVARRIAEEQGIDIARVPSDGKRRIEKADVLAYIDATRKSHSEPAPILAVPSARLTPASPKARRLAAERGIDITSLQGSGPEGAVLSEDVPLEPAAASQGELETPGTVWRLMAERMTASWTEVPHFYLMREVDAGSLIEWRERVSATVEKRTGYKPTYTDLLVKLIGVTLREHPRLNAAWAGGKVRFHEDVNVGLATAVDEGLIVPVIRAADSASLSEIVRRRKDLTDRARNRRLQPVDISDGTFTLSNLGMYNVDAFSAIINAPQAAILAVGRIADRVVPVKGQAVIRPVMLMTLSCDHRVVDGARGAQFLDDLADLIRDPWRLLA